MALKILAIIMELILSLLRKYIIDLIYALHSVLKLGYSDKCSRLTPRIGFDMRGVLI